MVAAEIALIAHTIALQRNDSKVKKGCTLHMGVQPFYTIN